MTVFHQPPADIGSHSAQSNNRYLHEISCSPGIGVQWAAISANSNVLKTPSNPPPAGTFVNAFSTGPVPAQTAEKPGKNRGKGLILSPRTAN
jgi:hypothetical protein